MAKKDFFSEILVPNGTAAYDEVRQFIYEKTKTKSVFTVSELCGNLSDSLDKTDVTSAITQLVNVGLLEKAGLANGGDCNAYIGSPYFNPQLSYANMIINVVGSTPVAKALYDQNALPSRDEERLMLMRDLGCLRDGVKLTKTKPYKELSMERPQFSELDGFVMAEIGNKGSFTIGIYDAEKQKSDQLLDWLNPNGKRKVCIKGNAKGALSLGDPLRVPFPKYSYIDEGQLLFILHSLGYDWENSRKFRPKKEHYKNSESPVLSAN